MTRFGLVLLGVAGLVALSLAVGPGGFGYDYIAFRLPRTIFAVVAGGALSVAGAALQAMFRNPLADPYVLGVSSGGAAGYVCRLLLGAGSTGLLSLPAALGSFAAFGAVWLLSREGKDLLPYRLLLSGVLVGFFCSGLVAVAMVFAREQAVSTFYLLWGHLGRTLHSGEVPAAAVVLAVVTALTFGTALFHRRLDALGLGEEEARSLGVNVGRTRLWLFLLTSVTVGALTALVGAIGFVGLVVPHGARRVVGHLHSRLLPACFLMGAGFLVAADLLVRAVTLYELPVGVVTALAGVPFFLWLIRRKVVEG